MKLTQRQIVDEKILRDTQEERNRGEPLIIQNPFVTPRFFIPREVMQEDVRNEWASAQSRFLSDEDKIEGDRLWLMFCENLRPTRAEFLSTLKKLNQLGRK